MSGEDGETFGQQSHALKVTVAKISKLPRNGGAKINPYVILTYGDKQAQTPDAIPCNCGLEDEYDVFCTCSFPLEAWDGSCEENPLKIYVIDAANEFRTLAKSSIQKWREVLRMGKRNLLVELQPAGTIKLDLRIIPKESLEKNTKADRLDIRFESLSKLPAQVSNPQIFARIGDTHLSTGQCRRVKEEHSGYFDIKECHTCRYNGESAIEFQIRDVDESSIGFTRFNLHDLLLATKTNQKMVGRLPVLDSKGATKGILEIGMALWDSSKTTAPDTLISAVEKASQRIKRDEELSQFLKNPMGVDEKLRVLHDELGEVQSGIATMQEPNKSRGALATQRRTLRTTLLGSDGIVAKLSQIEVILKNDSLAYASERGDEARKIKELLNTSLRESSLGQRPNVGATIQELEELIGEVEKKIKELDTCQQEIHNASLEDTGFMQDKLRIIDKISQDLNSLQCEGENIASHLAAMRKETRLTSRQQNAILSRIAADPQILERPIGCFPCCT